MLIKREPELPPLDYGIIWIGHKYKVILDHDDFLHQFGYHWRPKRKKKKIYAVRRFKRLGKTYEISMHRAIMHSRPGEEPHHKNHDTLDNRKSNLENVPHDNHPH